MLADSAEPGEFWLVSNAFGEFDEVELELLFIRLHCPVLVGEPLFVVLLFEFVFTDVGEPPALKSGHSETPFVELVLFTLDALDGELPFVIKPLLPRPLLLLLVLLVLVFTIWAARLLVSVARLAAAIESNVGESPRPSSRS